MSAAEPDDSNRGGGTAASGAHSIDRTGTERDTDTGTHSAGDPAVGGGVAVDRDAERRQVTTRQEAIFGGMKVGSDFFGWLTATAATVILTAIVTAAGAEIGVHLGIQPRTAGQNPQTAGLVGGIVLAVILFIAYLCGGFVAGRMARFNGLKQGLGVWLWALVIAAVIALIGLIVGNQSNIGSQISSFQPHIPVSGKSTAAAGVITAVVLAAIALAAALLGGLAGMRYHRKIDRAGFDREDSASNPTN